MIQRTGPHGGEKVRMSHPLLLPPSIHRCLPAAPDPFSYYHLIIILQVGPPECLCTEGAVLPQTQEVHPPPRLLLYVKTARATIGL